MRLTYGLVGAVVAVAITSTPRAQAPAAPVAAAPDPVRTLVSRLDLQRYKATIKGLTQFGDRRQGTERNRRAINWIETQLKSHGCPTGRLEVRVQDAAAESAGKERWRAGPKRRAPPVAAVLAGSACGPA